MNLPRHDQEAANKLYGSNRMQRNAARVKRMSTVRDKDFVGAWDYLHHHTQFPLGRMPDELRRECMENSK